MKQRFITTVCFLLFCLLTDVAQTTKTYTIEINRDDFEFGEYDGYFSIGPSDVDMAYTKDIFEMPSLLFKDAEIVLPEQEKLKNLTFTVGNYTTIPNVVIPPFLGCIPMDTNESNNEDIYIPYEIKDYPFEYEYSEQTRFGRRTAYVSFNVYAYNAITRTVSWPESFSITIETEPLEQWEYVSCSMPNALFIDEKILNPEDFWNEKKIPSIVGSVWSYVNYETTTDGEEEYDFFRYTVLDEPKELNGHTYYPMVKYSTCEYIPGQEELRVYLREEGCKIYKYLEQEGEETLLYNFAIQPYDKYFEKQHNYFKTVNGKALNISTQEKCFTAEDGFPFRKMTIENMTWIDGIGNVRDFLAEYNTKTGSSVLNYYRSGDGRVVYKNALTDLTSYKTDDCAISGANAIRECGISKKTMIQAIGQNLTCTSPHATKLEVYTMDALKVGEASFINGEAVVKVNKTPATYLYIVTYPDGRRESGKVVVK